jgi:hypothetical protein
VTVIRAGGDASWDDSESLKALDSYYDARLDIVRARSEKWLGGLTALTGLLGTVVILSGPEKASDVPMAGRIVVACLVASAFGALAFATYRAYQSAYGDPGDLTTIDRSPVNGLALRLSKARQADADQTQEYLRHAVVATFVGVTLIAVASGITWFTPTAVDESSSICLFFDQKRVAEISGSTVSLKSTAGGLIVGSCPSK